MFFVGTEPPKKRVKMPFSLKLEVTEQLRSCEEHPRAVVVVPSTNDYRHMNVLGAEPLCSVVCLTRKQF